MRCAGTVTPAACGSFLIGAEVPARSQDATPESRARRAIEQLRQRLNLPGLQVAIGKDGASVGEAYLGCAYLEAGREVTSASRFRIRSVYSREPRGPRTREARTSRRP